jgi:hypothetical protein
MNPGVLIGLDMGSDGRNNTDFWSDEMMDLLGGPRLKWKKRESENSVYTWILLNRLRIG